ncbi:hypothetical protein FM106_14615 [Brachybacterium faecium]|nr:hypothetical protein FM106_14615 [Brachybacterium faecium]
MKTTPEKMYFIQSFYIFMQDLSISSIFLCVELRDVLRVKK